MNGKNNKLLDKIGIIAYRLRALRKCNNLSQEAVAKHLSISRTAYNKYENGVIKPVRKLGELAALYNVSTDYLLGLEESSIESRIHAIDSLTTKQLLKYMSLSQKGREVVDITLNAVYDSENLSFGSDDVVKKISEK